MTPERRADHHRPAVLFHVNTYAFGSNLFTCGYTFHVGLLDHSQQSSLAAAPWLQQAREVAPLSKVRERDTIFPFLRDLAGDDLPVVLQAEGTC